MNLMTLQRYKNELILLLTFLFLLATFVYKLTTVTYVKENQIKINKEIEEIHTIVNLKKQWAGKDISKKLTALKTIVSSSKVKSFKKRSKKLSIVYERLTSNELNKVTNKLLNIAVQINHLKITKKSKNNYRMECTCKW